MIERVKKKGFNDLTEELAKKVVDAYYANEKIKDLLKSLGVTDDYRHIYEQFPPEVLDDKCEYCGSNLLKKRLARTNKNEEDHKASIYCSKCNHKPEVEKCECENCKKRPERIEEEQRKQIREYWGKARDKVDLTDLPFRAKVFLGVLLRTSCAEDMKTILPTSDSHEDIVPDGGNLLWEITNSLSVEYKAIVPSPDAPIKAFVLDDKDFPQHYYPVYMQYNLNLESSYSDYNIYLYLTSPTYYSEKDVQAAEKLWIEIASYECLAYLKNQLDEMGFGFKTGKKTQAIFRALLKDYSVSQIFMIIWMSVSSAARSILKHVYNDLDNLKIEQKKGETSKKHSLKLEEQLNGYKETVKKYKEKVGEYIVSYCREGSNYSEKEKKRIGHINKEELPQSEISDFFFNQVIGIGDKGFYNVPNKNDLKVE